MDNDCHNFAPGGGDELTQIKRHRGEGNWWAAKSSADLATSQFSLVRLHFLR